MLRETNHVPLSMWATPSPNTPINLSHSIIMIHGLQSRWSVDICQHDWLTEELPKSHLEARFFVWRDEAHEAQIFEDESISLETIRSIARKLLSECGRLQPQVSLQQPKNSSGNAHLANARPLIFICCGFGGLVVKEV